MRQGSYHLATKRGPPTQARQAEGGCGQCPLAFRGASLSRALGRPRGRNPELPRPEAAPVASAGGGSVSVPRRAQPGSLSVQAMRAAQVWGHGGRRVLRASRGRRRSTSWRLTTCSPWTGRRTRGHEDHHQLLHQGPCTGPAGRASMTPAPRCHPLPSPGPGGAGGERRSGAVLMLCPAGGGRQYQNYDKAHGGADWAQCLSKAKAKEPAGPGGQAGTAAEQDDAGEALHAGGGAGAAAGAHDTRRAPSPWELATQ